MRIASILLLYERIIRSLPEIKREEECRERSLDALNVIGTIAQRFQGTGYDSLEERLPEIAALLKQRETLAATASKVRSSMEQFVEHNELFQCQGR